MKSDYIILDMDRGVGVFENYEGTISTTPLIMAKDLTTLRRYILDMFYAASDIVTENYYDDWTELRPLDNPEGDPEDGEVTERLDGEARVRGRDRGGEMPHGWPKPEYGPRTDSLTGVQGDSEQLSEEAALSGRNWNRG